MRYSVYCKDRRVLHTRHVANQTKPFEDQGGRTGCFVHNNSAFSIEAGPSHALSQKSCDDVTAFGYGHTLDICAHLAYIPSRRHSLLLVSTVCVGSPAHDEDVAHRGQSSAGNEMLLESLGVQSPVHSIGRNSLVVTRKYLHPLVYFVKSVLLLTDLSWALVNKSFAKFLEAARAS
jgi:hypothetical protein